MNESAKNTACNVGPVSWVSGIKTMGDRASLQLPLGVAEQFKLLMEHESSAKIGRTKKKNLEAPTLLVLISDQMIWIQKKYDKVHVSKAGNRCFLLVWSYFLIMGLIVQLQGLDLPKFQNRCNCSKSIWLGSSLCLGRYRHTFGTIPTPLHHRLTREGCDLCWGKSPSDTHSSDVGLQKQWNLWKLAISLRYTLRYKTTLPVLASKRLAPVDRQHVSMLRWRISHIPTANEPLQGTNGIKLTLPLLGNIDWDYCVHVCPTKLSQKGNAPWFQNASK